MWDFETGNCDKTLSGPNTPDRHTSSFVRSVSVFEDANNDKIKFISGGGDNTIRIWDYETGHCDKTLSGPNTSDSHTNDVNSVLFDIKTVSVFQETSNGKIKFISGSCDETIKLWG